MENLKPCPYCNSSFNKLGCHLPQCRMRQGRDYSTYLSEKTLVNRNCLPACTCFSSSNWFTSACPTAYTYCPWNNGYWEHVRPKSIEQRLNEKLAVQVKVRPTLWTAALEVMAAEGVVSMSASRRKSYLAIVDDKQGLWEVAQTAIDTKSIFRTRAFQYFFDQPLLVVYRSFK